MNKLVIIFSLMLLTLTTAIHAAALEKVTLQLSWKYQFEFAGYIAAKEKGFYKEAGFDVTIRELQSGMSVVQEVLDGKADFGIYDADITFLAAEGKSVVWLQNYLKRPALAIVTKPNIFTPQDLEGKKIMASEEELDNSAVGMMFRKFGISPQNYTRVEHSYSIDAFKKGEVDAMVVYLSNEPYYLQSENIIYNLIDPVAYNIHTHSGNLFTSQKILEDSKPMVGRFMDATLKGWKYALEHQDELVEIIYHKYSQRKSMKALKYEAETLEKLIMPDFYPLGSISENQVYQNANFINQSGLIDGIENLDHYIYHAPLNISFSEQEKVYLQKKRVVKMCIDPDWLPFEKIENGEYIGMTSDYFNIFSENIGIPIEMIPAKTWSESIDLAKKRECDIFSLAMETPDRKQYMDFTTPYISMPLVVATTNEKVFISDVRNLIGKKIGVVKGYAFAELLRMRYPKMDLVEVETVKKGLQKVVNGELYGFADSLVTISYQIQHNFPGELKITGKFEEKFELGIGTRNDEPLLHGIFEKAITSLDQATHQDILNRWVSVSFESEMDYTLLWKIGFGATGVALLLTLIIAYQRKQHNALEKAHTATHDALESFKALFNSTLESIVIIKDGMIIEANDSMVQLFGCRKEEILGRSPFEFIDPAYHDLVKEKIEQDEVEPYEMVAISNSGEKINVLVRGKNVEFQGEKVRISAIVDISMQKMQQRSLEIVNEKLQELASHDQLTGLANRHMLEEFALKEIERHSRHGGRMSMMILDLDFFKQVNDTYGHLTGDYVLKEISRVLEAQSRGEDIVGRWGGEEFVVIMPETDIDDARNFAERLRKTVEQHVFKDVGRLTISIGLAEFKEGMSQSAWFTEADDCLYRAKANGRNCVVAGC